MVSTKRKSNLIYSFIEKHWALSLTSAILLAFLARLISLTKSSIWHDEGFSIMLALRSPIEIWLGSARDVHPPLYYEMLHFWTEMFGKSVLAVRSLSLLAGLLIIWLGYEAVYKITSKRNVALLAGFFLALNPFLIRYSQEARMYGVLGVFLLVAMIGIIRIVKNNRDWLSYVMYIFGVAAGLYTHYFTALVVLAFWTYVVSIYFGKGKIKIITNWRWWASNFVAALLFLPWLPNMIAQFTRAQGLGWLSKTSIRTFNDTIWQFFTFTDARQIWQIIYWVAPLLLLVLIVYVYIKDKSKEKYSRLLVLFTFLPVFVTIFVSFVRPVFHERYFAFAAIGACMMVALAVYYLAQNQKKYLSLTVATLVVLIQLVGIRNVYAQSNHQMSKVMNFVNDRNQSQDQILAGELYVYFDGSYYNKSGKRILLYTGGGRPNGFGESGLIYDKNVYIDNYSQINGDRVWIIGKTGDQNYYKKIPVNWKLIESISAGYSEARLYQIQ